MSRKLAILALALSTTFATFALSAGSASAGDDAAPTYTEASTDTCTTTK